MMSNVDPGPWEIEVSVISKKGECSFGHEVGDKIIFDGKTIKGNVCYDALNVLLEKVHAMRYGAVYVWQVDKDILLRACPDPENPVVFQIRRVRK